ncbi:MAG: spermidine/putrescine ABC transporter substrate-binding protein [Tissierellia bacterium]|nr:spermidine/putrescine ABC transporter substrate-binding protein [Tissierellia bacterium]
MKKQIIFILFLMLFLLTACGKKNTANTINVYNWGEYIDTEILKEFEEETGIKVNYSTYASNEDLYIKLAQSSDSYDVVIPSDYMIERLIREDLLEEIDLSKLKHWNLIEDALKNPSFDPENKYSVPYFWGTVGIVYNHKNIGEKIDSWNALWDPKYKDKIIMYNSQRDSIGIALKRLGYSLNSTDPRELEEAKESLIQQKPLVYAYLTDDGRDVILQEDADMALMYSGDAAMMMEENEYLSYVVPKEGSNLWYDSMVIPKSAKNIEGAHLFIDFMCRPDIAAKNALYSVGYTSPVRGVKEMLPKEIQESKVAYPDFDSLPPLEVFVDLGKDLKLYDRVWTEVNATF